MTVAPESFSWCSSSRAVYIGLTLTTVIPARSTPNSATGYCRRLGSMIATRSPFLETDHLLQVGAELPAGVVEFAIGDRDAHVAVRRKLGELAAASLQYLLQRVVLRQH